MKIGYARVSTNDQVLSLADQERELLATGCERVFTDVVSGVRADRPGFTDMVEHLRNGDEVVVTRLDRLGRSANDTMRTLEDLDGRGVTVQALDQRLDTSNATGRLVVAILAHLAEWERDLMRERTKAAVAEARRQGRVPGPRPKLSAAQRERVLELLDKGATVAEVARMFDVSEQSIYRVRWSQKQG